MGIIVNSGIKLGLFSPRPIFFLRIRERIQFEVKLVDFSVDRVKNNFRSPQAGAQVFLDWIGQLIEVKLLAILLELIGPKARTEVIVVLALEFGLVDEGEVKVVLEILCLDPF